jgi:Heterokaryon incompatibility protein (HET)
MYSFFRLLTFDIEDSLQLTVSTLHSHAILFLPIFRMRPYHYQPLEANHIRLIKLQPSCRTGRHLVALIQTLSLSIADGTYDALSYAWGDPTTTPCRLLCGDGSFLSITTNLYQALLHLREEKETRLLWVDAVCISQVDLTEKGAQVNLMREIYAKAKKAVVFLGEERVGAEAEQEESWEGESDASDVRYNLGDIHDSRTNAAIAVDFVNAINWKITRTIADQVGKAQHHMVAATPDQLTMAENCSMLIGSDSETVFRGFPRERTCLAVAELLSRPWFHRAWVVQEFIVAREVEMFVGRRKCEWGSLLPAYFFAFIESMEGWVQIFKKTEPLQGKISRAIAQIKAMHELRNSFHDKTKHNYKRQRLGLLLAMCRTGAATHAVDKIYSLLGLSDDFDHYDADYTKSKTDIYLHIATCIIAKSQLNESVFEATETLYEAAVSDKWEEGLPSWVPDWTEVRTRMNLAHSLSRSGECYFSAGSKETGKGPRPVLEIDGKVLKSTGFVFGMILNLGKAEEEAARGKAPGMARAITILGEMLKICDRRNVYPTGEDLFDVVDMILEADQQREGDSSGIPFYYGDSNKQGFLPRLQPEELESVPNDLPEVMIERIVQFFMSVNRYQLRNISMAIAGRRFAMTTKAYAGLVPTAAQIGDEIVILQGFRVPFVLRQRPVGGFVLIGDCYLHGIMLGEALRASNPPVMRMIEIH